MTYYYKCTAININKKQLLHSNFHSLVTLHFKYQDQPHFSSWHEMFEGWPIELSFPSPGHHVRNAHGQRWPLQVGIVEPPSGSKFIILACDVARTCENLDDKYLQRDCGHGHAVDCSKIHLLLVTSCYTFWPLNGNLPLTSVSSSHKSCPSFVLDLTVFFLSFKPEEKTKHHTRLALAGSSCLQQSRAALVPIRTIFGWPMRDQNVRI